jgi:hypothetical protein
VSIYFIKHIQGTSSMEVFSSAVRWMVANNQEHTGVGGDALARILGLSHGHTSASACYVRAYPLALAVGLTVVQHLWGEGDDDSYSLLGHGWS